MIEMIPNNSKKRVSIDETRNEVIPEPDLGSEFAFHLKLSRQTARQRKAPKSDVLWDGNLRAFRLHEISEEELIEERMMEMSQRMDDATCTSIAPCFSSPEENDHRCNAKKYARDFSVVL